MINDWVEQTTTTTGTGPVNLDGIPAGRVPFSQNPPVGIGSGNQCYYLIDDNAGNWEIGIGTVTAGAPDTLSRSIVIRSSNGDALVNFGVGTKSVRNVFPAELTGAGGGRLHYGIAVDGGLPRMISLTLAPPVRALIDGARVAFQAFADCPEEDVEFIFGRPLRKGDGTVKLAHRDIRAGQIVEARYNLARDVWIMTSPVANTPAIAGEKSAVMNGDFDVWQRGTSFAIGASTYHADRWKGLAVGGGGMTVSRQTNVPTVAQAGRVILYSARSTVTTLDASLAATDMYIAHRQAIEGYRWRHFVARGLTVSFWVRAAKIGTHCVAIINNTGTSCAIVLEYTINQADTWEYKELQIPPSPSGLAFWTYTEAADAFLSFPLAAGSNFQSATPGAWESTHNLTTAAAVNEMDTNGAIFAIAGVQLEVGPATAFEILPFDAEFRRCQRFYSHTFPYGTAPAQNAGLAGAVRVGSQAAGALVNRISWRPPMPISPDATVGTLYNPSAANAQARNVSDGADLTATTIVANDAGQVEISATGTAGTAAGEDLALHLSVGGTNF